MGLLEAHDPRILRSYEGLVFCTAQLALRSGVEEELEDIQQLLRVAVFKALKAYTGGDDLCVLLAGKKCRCRRCRFVFSCVKNRQKDVLDKRRRRELYIEDVAPSGGSDGRDEGQAWGKHSDPFISRYMSTTHDDVYGEIDENDVLLPDTLDQLEVQIVVLLYRDYLQTEIARQLGLEKGEMERAMRSIREKMADWRPIPALPAAA